MQDWYRGRNLEEDTNQNRISKLCEEVFEFSKRSEGNGRAPAKVLVTRLKIREITVHNEYLRRIVELKAAHKIMWNLYQLRGFLDQYKLGIMGFRDASLEELGEVLETIENSLIDGDELAPYLEAPLP